MQSSIFVPVHAGRQLFITCAEISSILPLLPAHAPRRKLAARIALTILIIAGIAVLSGATTHVRALPTHSHGLKLAARIAFVELEAVAGADLCVGAGV
jgi:hypothetical protein